MRGDHARARAITTTSTVQDEREPTAMHWGSEPELVGPRHFFRIRLMAATVAHYLPLATPEATTAPPFAAASGPPASSPLPVASGPPASSPLHLGEGGGEGVSPDPPP